MGLFDFFKAPKKKMTIDDLKMEDLKREKIHWSNEVTRYERREEELVESEAKLKSEYARADRESMKRSIARKIQSIRTEQKGIADKIQFCFKHAQIAENFINIKRDKDFYTKEGISSVMDMMSVEEIESMMTQTSEDGVLKREKLAALLKAQQEGMDLISSSEEDDSLKDLMAELDAETEGQKVDQGTDRLERDLEAKAQERTAQVDKELRPNDMD